MSGGRPQVSLYVFPLFATLKDLWSLSTNLLQRTFFADTADIPPWLIDNHSHQVLVYPHYRIGVAQSERKEIKLIPFEEMLKSIEERRIGATIKELLENLKSKELKGAKVRSARPMFTFYMVKY